MHVSCRSILRPPLAAPGVLAVYTGHDYKADGLSMPKAMMPRKKRPTVRRCSRRSGRRW